MKKLTIFTLLLLLTLATNTYAQTFTEPLRYGMRNNSQVFKLQEMLTNLGYLPPNNKTGNFFNLTQKAVKEYQKANNLSIDGQVGPETRTSLNKLNITSASTSFEGTERYHQPDDISLDGCQLGYSFSVTTGKPCINTISNTCLPSYTFNPLTGERCQNNLINTTNAKYKIGDEFILGCTNCDTESYKVLGYKQNISDSKLSAIVAYPTTHFGNSSDVCGWGNIYVPYCVIFILNNNIIQDKQYVWPDRAERDFPDSFKRIDINNADNNLYGQSFPHLGFVSSVSYEGDNIKFLTRREDSCANFVKETWNLNVKTGIFSLLNSQRISADGC